MIRHEKSRWTYEFMDYFRKRKEDILNYFLCVVLCVVLVMFPFVLALLGQELLAKTNELTSPRYEKLHAAIVEYFHTTKFLLDDLGLKETIPSQVYVITEDGKFLVQLSKDGSQVVSSVKVSSLKIRFNSIE